MELQDDLAGKRILFVITKSNWGGAQAYVYMLAKHCHKAGADVAVAFGGTGRPESETGLLAEQLALDGIRAIVLPSLSRDISLAAEWRAFRELRACIENERSDVLHLNSSKTGVLGALAGRLAGVPRIVFTAHGWAYRESRSLVWRILVWKVSWLTVFLSHAIIVVSERDWRGAPVLFSRRKVYVVHNGVASFLQVPKEEARRFLASNLAALQKLPKWVLIPAELTRNKGIDFAIRAFARVSTSIDDTALVVVGGGEEHARLTDHIKEYGLEDRVFLCGFVADVRRYLAAADVFLLPSRKEGLPLALLEAGITGLPAIASRTGGIPEIITHEINGLLVTPGNIDGLVDALTRLLLNTEEARAFGARLKETVQNKFSAEEMFAKTVAVYTS